MADLRIGECVELKPEIPRAFLNGVRNMEVQERESSRVVFGEVSRGEVRGSDVIGCLSARHQAPLEASLGPWWMWDATCRKVDDSLSPSQASNPHDALMIDCCNPPN